MTMSFAARLEQCLSVVCNTSHRSTMVVDQSDAHRLEAASVEFAYLHDHEMPDGSYRIVTVPVN
jgi:hypothetical protein